MTASKCGSTRRRGPKAGRLINLSPIHSPAGSSPCTRAGSTKADPNWNGNWLVKCGQQDGWWHCEIAIPLASIAPGRKAADGAWGINVCRNWKQPWAFSSLGGGAYAPGKDIVFRFASDVSAVRHEHRRDPLSGEVESVLSLSGLANLRAVQRLQRDMMPDVLVDEKLGEKKEIPLRVQDAGSKSMKLSIDVTSDDGKTIYYQRQTAWKASPGAWAWKTAKPIKLPIDLQFAYYPYLERMRVLADISGLPAGGESSIPCNSPFAERTDPIRPLPR